MSATTLRLGKSFNVSPELWLGLDVDYDIRVAWRTIWPEIEPRIRVRTTWQPEDLTLGTYVQALHEAISFNQRTFPGFNDPANVTDIVVHRVLFVLFAARVNAQDIWKARIEWSTALQLRV